jgi:uncharacterized protein YheU (UPF0270 family)
VIEIPPHKLPGDVLDALIESFILREGTDYGDHEVSLENKLSQVRYQVEKGQVIILFDEDSESCTLMTKRDWQRYQSALAQADE